MREPTALDRYAARLEVEGIAHEYDVGIFPSTPSVAVWDQHAFVLVNALGEWEWDAPERVGPDSPITRAIALIPEVWG